MKTIKRICTLLLAVMLIASFTVSAFAEEAPAAEGEQPLGSEATAADGVKNAPSAEGSDSTTTADTIGNVWINENSTDGGKFVRVEGNDIGQNEHTNVKWERNGSTTTVDITADIVCSSSNDYGLRVVDIHTGQTINVTVGDPDTPGSGGNITSENTNGISVSVYDGGTVAVTTAGDIKSSNKGVYTSAGDIVKATSGNVTVTTGNITAGGTGIEVNPRYSGSITVTADSVNADNNGIVVHTANGSSDKACTAEVTVKENVTGSTGIKVIGSESYSTGQTTITVGTANDDKSGTVTGGIDLSDSQITGDNTHITLWKVEGSVTGDQAVIEKVMNYFVRKDTPGDNGTLTVANDPKVINGSDEIPLTIQPADGYVIDTVYYNQSDNKTITPTNGQYYLKALPTGGIMLKATFKPISSPAPDPPKPEPKPTAGPVATTCKLTFDLGGGTIDGKSEYSKTYSYGQHIKLPIPEREGYTFGGWETTVRGKTVTYESGSRYTVTAAKTFTAIWIEN